MTLQMNREAMDALRAVLNDDEVLSRDEGMVIDEILERCTVVGPGAEVFAADYESARQMNALHSQIRNQRETIRQFQQAQPPRAEPVAEQAAHDFTGLLSTLRRQRQCDMDGTECAVNRQAVDEAIEIIEALATGAAQ